jgi:hypothetical protein
MLLTRNRRPFEAIDRDFLCKSDDSCASRPSDPLTNVRDSDLGNVGRVSARPASVATEATLGLGGSANLSEGRIKAC